MSTPEVITNSNSDVKPQNAKKSKRGSIFGIKANRFINLEEFSKQKYKK